MAKVMISMPDELLHRLDSRARAEHVTRSGLLQRLAEQELSRDEDERRRQVRELLDRAGSHDGRAVEHVRADRSR